MSRQRRHARSLKTSKRAQSRRKSRSCRKKSVKRSYRGTESLPKPRLLVLKLAGNPPHFGHYKPVIRALQSQVYDSSAHKMTTIDLGSIMGIVILPSLQTRLIEKQKEKRLIEKQKENEEEDTPYEYDTRATILQAIVESTPLPEAMRDIPVGVASNSLAEELEKFKNSKEGMTMIPVLAELTRKFEEATEENRSKLLFDETESDDFFTKMKERKRQAQNITPWTTLTPEGMDVITTQISRNRGRTWLASAKFDERQESYKNVERLIMWRKDILNIDYPGLEKKDLDKWLRMSDMRKIIDPGKDEKKTLIDNAINNVKGKNRRAALVDAIKNRIQLRYDCANYTADGELKQKLQEACRKEKEFAAQLQAVNDSVKQQLSEKIGNVFKLPGPVDKKSFPPQNCFIESPPSDNSEVDQLSSTKFRETIRTLLKNAVDVDQWKEKLKAYVPSEGAVELYNAHQFRETIRTLLKNPVDVDQWKEKLKAYVPSERAVELYNAHQLEA